MAITVKIAKVPGFTHEVALEDGATVARALTQYRETSGEYTEGFEVRDASGIVEATATLNDGDRLYLSQQVKGGR